MHSVYRRQANSYDPQANIFLDARFLGLTRSRQMYAVAQWNRARANRGLRRVMPPDVIGTNTHKPPVDRNTGERDNSYIEYRDAFPNAAIPTLPAGGTASRSNLPEDIENLPGFEGLEHLNNPQPGPSGVKRPAEVGAEGERPAQRPRPLGAAVEEHSLNTSNPNSPDYIDPSQIPPTPTEADMAHNNNGAGPSQPMEVGGATNLATAGGGPGGGGVSSSGGFDSAQGPNPYIQQPSYGCTPGVQNFKQVHRMVSWAIPFTPLNDAAGVESGNKWITTPLMEIPWKYPYLFMSKEEFDNMLITGSRIIKAKIHVQHLTSTTQFETGGDTVQTSTTNNAKIFISGYDLERALRGGKTRKVTIGSDMKPTKTEVPTRQTFIDTQYGVDQSNAAWDTNLPGACFGIPYYSNDYFCVYQPNKAKAAAQQFNAGNAPGYEAFLSCVTECNMNDMSWSTVFEKDYTFSSAPVGTPFRMIEINPEGFEQMIGSNEGYNMLRDQADIEPGDGGLQTQSILPQSYVYVKTVGYDSTMEQGCINVHGAMPFNPKRQPSVHVGMRAIDKMKANLNTPRATEFVAAKAQFVVTATLTVETPSYPNRFTLPKYPNVSIEKAVKGVNKAFIDDDSPDQYVTWNQLNVGTPTRRATRANPNPVENVAPPARRPRFNPNNIN